MKAKGIIIICILLLSVFMITSVCASEDIDDSEIEFYDDSIEIDDTGSEDLKSNENSYEQQEDSAELLKNGFDDELKDDSVIPQIEYREYVWDYGVYNISVNLPEDYNGNVSIFVSYPAKEELLLEGSVVNGSGIFELSMEKVHFDVNKRDFKFNYVDNIKNYSYSKKLSIQAYHIDHNDLSYINRDFSGENNYFFSDSDKFEFTFSDVSNTGFFDLYIDGIFYETKEAKYSTTFLIPKNLSLGLHTYNLSLRDSVYYGNVNLSRNFEIVPISVSNVEAYEDDEYHILSVTLAENATGYVRVFLNGSEIAIESPYNRSEYSEELPEQLLFKTMNYISLYNTPNGDYQGLVYFYSNLRNEPFIVPFHYLNSKQYDPTDLTYCFAITMEDMYENDTHIVSINMPETVTGQLVVKTISSAREVIETYVANLEGGTAKVIVPPSDSIERISGAFDHDNYLVIPLYEYIIHKPKLNMSVFDTKDGLIVQFSENTSGCVNVEYDNESYFGFVVNGKALFQNFHPLKKVTISYVDIDKVRSIKNKTYPVKLIEIDSELSIDTSDITIGSDAIIKISTIDELNEKIVVSVNDNNYTVDIVNGSGTLNMLNLSAGTYVVNAYIGNKYIKLANVTKTFRVIKKTPCLTVNVNNISAGQNLEITVGADKDISDNVILNVNNENYILRLINGSYTLNIADLNPGDYVVRAVFEGNDDFLAQNETKTFKVSYIPKVTAKATSVLYSSKGKYSVTVYGDDGKVAKDVTVVFKINGKKVTSVKTNSKGDASFTITKLPGTYKVSATALGKTATKTLTVKHVISMSSVKVKKSSKKLVLTATLKKINGKYLKNKKITFKFNGKKYIAKTNKKGVAKITIKKSVLKKLKVGKNVIYQATYLKDTVKKSVKVKK